MGANYSFMKLPVEIQLRILQNMQHTEVIRCLTVNRHLYGLITNNWRRMNVSFDELEISKMEDDFRLKLKFYTKKEDMSEDELEADYNLYPFAWQQHMIQDHQVIAIRTRLGFTMNSYVQTESEQFSNHLEYVLSVVQINKLILKNLCENDTNRIITAFENTKRRLQSIEFTTNQPMHEKLKQLINTTKPSDISITFACSDFDINYVLAESSVSKVINLRIEYPCILSKTLEVKHLLTLNAQNIDIVGVVPLTASDIINLISFIGASRDSRCIYIKSHIKDSIRDEVEMKYHDRIMNMTSISKFDVWCEGFIRAVRWEWASDYIRIIGGEFIVSS